ncbi:MAG: response regulator [Deltaproteobacteria bacterium]|nr:response regulator [Deltaproteobacteria bacterium]
MVESLRILILEDNPADAELIQFELEQAGLIFTAKVVMTEAEYIQAIQDFSPDLILSDYDLPRYNGALALSEAKRRCPDIPFILVTGAVSEDRAIEILTQGAKDYVLKKLLEQRLGAAVRRAVAEAEEHRARRQAEDELREAYQTLEEKVKIRTAELEAEVTARRMTEEALRQQRELLHITLASIGDAVITTDGQGRVTFMNAVAEALTGWTLSEASGRSATEVFHIINERTRQAVESPVTRVLKEGAVVGLANHTALLRKDGTEIPIDDSGAPIRDAEGKTLGVVLVFHDITERKRVEAVVRQQAQLLDLSYDAILAWDLGGAIEYWNQGAENLYGFSPEEAVGRVSRELLNTRYPMDVSELKAILEREGMWIGEIDHVTKDGRPLTVESRHQLIRDVAGREIVLETNRDMTSQKRAKADQERLQAQLHQSQKMESIGRLAGGVAHDFNNMLGVILGHVELALEQITPDQPLHSDIQAIQKAAERSADLTRRLLAFARKQTISPRVLDINETVTGMLTMLHRLIGEDIHLNWQPGKDLWPTKMDPSQIDQILANLCVNARDAITGVGKVTIETSHASFDAAYCADHGGFLPGDFVLLTLSDNGCGMDKETLDKLFEPFFTTKELGKSTGLGLATVYGIVKQNNGFIIVDSAPGQGTTFRIYLPRHRDKAEQPWTPGPQKSTPRSQETLLVVEDEVEILHMAKRMLEKQGYQVLTAATPREAIRLAEGYAGEIHLLITDVVMPEMNGRELSKKILARYPNLKRLFMSGYTADVIAYQGILDDGVRFLQKPFSTQNLAAKVREALEQN